MDVSCFDRAPAQKNRVIFIRPWWTRWTRPPMVAKGPNSAGAERDVGDLADGGEGQPALDVGLLQGAQRGVEDGDGGEDRQRQAEARAWTSAVP
jgi:hypothetical protein